MKNRRIDINKFKVPYRILLGCGDDKKEGWIGLDCGEYNQDVLWDLRDGLPFADNSCMKIYANQVLEHIQMNEDFIFIMNECLRVLKDKGLMIIRVPLYNVEDAIKDPTHCRFFCLSTFTYLEKENKWQYGFDKRWTIRENKKLGESQLFTMLQANKNYENK